MLEQMVVKAVRPEYIRWDNPKTITLKEKDKDEVVCDLLKGAKNFLYSKIDLKSSTSEDLYKKSKEIWTELKDLQLDKCGDSNNVAPFTLDDSKLVYLVANDREVVDMIDFKEEVDIKEFTDKLNKYVLDITTTQLTHKFFADGKGGVIKLICYRADSDLLEQEFTPVVILEFNNIKSEYRIYTGILIYSTFTFVPTSMPYMECASMSNIIKFMNLSEILEASEESAQGLYDAYTSFKSNPVEISSRELLSFLKQAGYKLELQDDANLAPIESISDEENRAIIQEFFNTFVFSTGESAYDILKLSDIKKVFRYNKLTILDLLAILSKEYLTYDGSKINCNMLSSLVSILYTKQYDKRVMKDIEQEIQD